MQHQFYHKLKNKNRGKSVQDGNKEAAQDNKNDGDCADKTGCGFTRSKTPRKLLAAFDPIPSRKVQEKIDFFFLPYTGTQQISKKMVFQRSFGEDEQDVMSNLRILKNNPDVDDTVRVEAQKAIKMLLKEHQSTTKSNWKKVSDLIFNHQDRRPIQHVVNHFRKLKKYEDGELTKEMRKRKSRKRHLQIIDVSGEGQKDMLKQLGVQHAHEKQSNQSVNDSGIPSPAKASQIETPVSVVSSSGSSEHSDQESVNNLQIKNENKLK